tara:strand:- start:5071 stop:5280 length:210 start_codon:yes stop_codon:yes gene_type:complete
MDVVTIKVKPTDNNRFAVYIYVAGQWELEKTYKDRATANRVAMYYKQNNRAKYAFATVALHRRKYPIVK